MEKIKAKLVEAAGVYRQDKEVSATLRRFYGSRDSKRRPQSGPITGARGVGKNFE